MRARFLPGPFPFRVPPVAAPAVGRGTEYPVGLTLEAAAEIYYRRVAHMECQYQVSATGAPPESNTLFESGGTGFDVVQMEQPEDGSPAQPISNERQLLVPGALDRFAHRAQERSNSVTIVYQGQLFHRDRAPIEVEGDSYASITSPRMVFCMDDGLFYPRCNLRMTRDDRSFGSPKVTIHWSSYPLNFPDGSQEAISPGATVTILGQTFEGFAYSTRYLNGQTIDGQSGNLTLGLGQGYPYIGVDGVALYNMDGTPANNPATGAPFTPAEIAAAPFP